MGTRKYIVTLTSEERQCLTQLVSKGRDKAYRIKHANLLLAVDENGPNLTSQEAAKVFSCHLNTVTGICQRFVEQGLEAALDRKPRLTPPTPRKLDGRGEARLIALACRKPPEGIAHWSLRLLADQLVELGVVESISYETVRRMLKKTS
jgi:transposase